jgi:hypothetical protein
MSRRQRPTTFQRFLGVHISAAAPSRWPRRNELPSTLWAKAAHLLVGFALGIVVGAILIEWARAGFPR